MPQLINRKGRAQAFNSKVRQTTADKQKAKERSNYKIGLYGMIVMGAMMWVVVGESVFSLLATMAGYNNSHISEAKSYGPQ